MLVRDTKGVYKTKVLNTLGKDATRDQVLDYILGYDDFNNCPFVIREWCGKDEQKTFVNRINMIWCIPLTLILAPFRYLLYGYIGWDDKTKFGRWILKITGNLKEA